MYSSSENRVHHCKITKLDNTNEEEEIKKQIEELVNDIMNQYKNRPDKNSSTFEFYKDNQEKIKKLFYGYSYENQAYNLLDNYIRPAFFDLGMEISTPSLGYLTGQYSGDFRMTINPTESLS